MKGDVMEATNFFKLNASFMPLIPKVDNPIGLNEYKPISQVDCIGKLCMQSNL